jgi:aminoglycoside phosphotransferase (APT) family kinase protein
LEEEADAAREFLQITSLPTPQVEAIGEPHEVYSLPWSVHTWLPGVDATEVDTSESESLADEFAGLIELLRRADTRGRVFSPGGRGGDLTAHDRWMEECFATWPATPDVTILRRAWSTMRELPRLPVPDVMSHRDLIPGNVLLTDGHLTGVLDCGGLGPADPALDLIAAWHFFEAGSRDRIRRALGCTDLEWARSRAWAFEQAIGAAWYYGGTNPAMYRMGVRTVARVVASIDLGEGA